MKTLFLVLPFLVSFPLLAKNKVEKKITWSECVEQGKRQEGLFKVDPLCFNLAIKNNEYLKKASFSDNKFSYNIVGMDNILFIESIQFLPKENKKRIQIISGPHTQLGEIVSLNLSSDGKEIYVFNLIDSKKSILVFKTNRSGDISPRALEDDSINNAKDFALSADNKFIYLLLNEKIIKINAKANSKSELAKMQVSPLLAIEDESFKQASHISIHNEDLYVLNPHDAMINVLDLNSLNLTDQINLKENNIIHPIYMTFNQSNKILIIGQKNKEALLFEIEKSNEKVDNSVDLLKNK